MEFELEILIRLKICQYSTAVVFRETYDASIS